MTESIKLYGSQVRYWVYIFITVIVFGTLVGAAGLVRLNNLPKLTLIDTATKAQIIQRANENSAGLKSLEGRVTEIEEDVQQLRPAKAK